MALERSHLDFGGWRAGTAEAHRAAVARVIDVMREQVSQPPSLGEMADVACLSPFHFDRVFRYVTGVPPGAFLAALRLDAAKRLLLTTDLSVTDVCFELGYRSLGTFTTRFAQATGLPPGQLRQLALTFAMPSPEHLGSVGRKRGRSAVVHGGVGGCVCAPDGFSGLIFVGLFPTPVPQGLPVAGDMLSRPGHYHLTAVPDGRYYVRAAALPRSGDLRDYLVTAGPRIRVGVGDAPLVVRGGWATGRGDVTLRPAELTDPPVLISLLYLLARRLDKSGERGR